MIVILSNNNDETGNGDTTLRKEEVPVKTRRLKYCHWKQIRRRSVFESTIQTTMTTATFWNRRILTTPPEMSPLKKQPVLFSSNVNTPEKASESKSNAVVKKNDADTIRRGPTKRIPKTTTTIQTTVKITKRQRLKLQQKQEETDRARLDLLAIARKEEKKRTILLESLESNCDQIQTSREKEMVDI